MTKDEIIAKVKELNLPKGSYIVFGSCPLAVAGIRKAADIDLLVSEAVFEKLGRAGWRELYKGPGDKPLTHDVFEAHDSWLFSSYNPTLEHLLKSATMVDGVPFASLEEVRKWKTASGRPKDLIDAKLIDGYLGKRGDLNKLTPHNDVNRVLALLRDGLKEILGDQLVGLYLTGSLTYGDFDYGSSDIDFLAVLAEPLTDKQRLGVVKLHENIAQAEPKWAKRIEGSYITKDMLSSIEPPENPRPYINSGKFWDPDPRYRNEWTVNLFMLHERGIALLGPDPKKIFPSVDTVTLQKASRKMLLEDWNLKEPSDFENSDYDTSHLQAYTILTMCRILYTAKNHTIASKRVASAWAKKIYDGPWSNLIEKAENWRHGQNMDEVQRTVDFVNFTITELR